MHEKIGVFVDLIGLFGSVKSAFNGKKVDYNKYLEKIEDYGTIYRSYAYGAYKGDEANTFINCLSNMGFEPKYVRAVYVDDKPNVRETDRSMDMVVDILRIIDRIDTVVLGTLNTKWIPFIDYLRTKGIKVILFSCNVKKELINSVNEYWIINERILEEEKAPNDASFVETQK